MGQAVACLVLVHFSLTSVQITQVLLTSLRRWASEKDSSRMPSLSSPCRETCSRARPQDIRVTRRPAA